MYIYVYTNKITGQQYVGQTNNLQKRYNGHKSDSYNKNSHSYDYPLQTAIREYGLDNFAIDVLEEIKTKEEANNREQYWIEKMESHISKGGYNISLGGTKRNSLTWEELKEKGKLFTGKEIEDIQQRLIKGEKYNDIIDFYAPRLTRTFLSNINHGTNYKTPSLDYPLKKNFKGEGNFSLEEIAEIKNEIKSGMIYSEIAKKHGIKSKGFLSMINSGKYYYDENENYPLKLKGCADKSWIKDCLRDIIFSSDSFPMIAKKYNKHSSTISKLAQGRANKQEYLIYPIRSHIEENKELFNKYF